MPPSTTSKRAWTTARISSLRKRPPGLGDGSKSLIRSHSASVRSVGYGLAFIPTVYRTDATYGRLFKQPLRHTRILAQVGNSGPWTYSIYRNLVLRQLHRQH